VAEQKLYRLYSSLPSLEPHYSRHVRAMTVENLRSKSDIAAELAYRDQYAEELRTALAMLLKVCGKSNGDAVDVARHLLRVPS